MGWTLICQRSALEREGGEGQGIMYHRVESTMKIERTNREHDEPIAHVCPIRGSLILEFGRRGSFFASQIPYAEGVTRRKSTELSQCPFPFLRSKLQRLGVNREVSAAFPR